jgi:adenine-specific DNA-methyltransferase
VEPATLVYTPAPKEGSVAEPGDRLTALRELVPEAFVEGALDLDRLRAALGDPPVQEGPERYGLSWAGKAEAIAQVRRPATGRLVPCPDDSWGWHTTGHVLVEGDNLEVLRLLQPSLAGRVGLIYIDPPYNTGEDFVYRDDFRDPLAAYLRATGQDPAGGDRLETAGRYHSRWLSMMYPRLHLARSLLRPDGLLLVSIDEHEHRNLVLLLCEIFGEENLLGDFIWKKKSGGGSDARGMVLDHEYVVCFARSAATRLRDDPKAEVSTSYAHVDSRGPYALERLDKQNLGYEASLDFPIEGPDGRSYRVHHKDPRRKQARWRWSRKTVSERADELVFRGGFVYTKNHRKAGSRPRSLLVDGRFGRTRTGRADLVSLFGDEVLDHPKPVRLIQHFVRIATRPDDLVLDFFAGSATTAHAVYACNAEDGGDRRFLCVQLPEPCAEGTAASAHGFEHIAGIARERIRRAANGLPEAAIADDRGCRVFRLESGEALPSTPRESCLVWAIILASGLPLTALTEPIGEHTWSVEGGSLLVCLDPRVPLDGFRALLARDPREIACLDSAFAGDDALRVQVGLEAKRAGVRLRTP